jgi:predicted secreted Zn-dependent protease
MLAADVVSAVGILETLIAMRDDPRCHVPAQELARRIRQLSE